MAVTSINIVIEQGVDYEKSFQSQRLMGLSVI